jgi:sucrose phosphorylase
MKQFAEGFSRPKQVRIRYLPKPDYTKPLYEISQESRDRMFKRLQFLYGESKAQQTLPELERILKVHYAHKPEELITWDSKANPVERFTEKDLVLITYGDLVQGKGHSPLASLAEFIQRPRFRNLFNTIHILPFFPYSSDRGFSITDFKSVDPNLGSWSDIDAIGEDYQLMFDGVLNHASAESPEFQDFLNGSPSYQDMVIAFRSADEITPEQRQLIRRPRTSDILTRFISINGPVWVWTTFSPDQVDLNYKNPQVLIDIIETLLLYIRRGADIIRLDAVTYLWDELGTTCASLDQTHQVIKLFRDVVDLVAPRTALLTETNVPHEENISYFGDGTDEAHMVYNFALPPLVLHAFYRGDVSYLNQWASGLEFPSNMTSYLNILDTHDGIGVLGAKSFLPESEIDFLAETARNHGGYISYRSSGDGIEKPYEINTTWWGALNQNDDGEDLALKVKRFISSRSIALVLRGVPGLYFHGIIGTENDSMVVDASGHNRDINRVPIQVESLLQQLDETGSKLDQIRSNLGMLGETRISQRAFHPDSSQKVLSVSPAVFSVLRETVDTSERVMTFANVTNMIQNMVISLADTGSNEVDWCNLLNDLNCKFHNGKLCLELMPYEVIWLKPKSEF